MNCLVTMGATAALFFASVAPDRADGLVFSGVLGNSGEQSSTLVRFGLPPARGLGVVYDKYGTLWDRGGDGVLNRYAVDGRLMATYPIAKSSDRNDSIASDGASIFLLLRHHLYSLPIDALGGTASTDLKINADQISPSVVRGKLAVATGETISYLNVTTGQLEPAVKAPVPGIRSLEMLPDGGVVAEVGGNKASLFRDGVEVITQGWPRPSPGKVQFLNSYFYDFAWHGTVKRFDPDLNAAPGVILGGSSGSFIGHIASNSDLEMGNGIAQVNDETFALSGINGVVNLARWNKELQQLEIVRRIGSVSVCRGLALNRQGDVWCTSGPWKWSDTPASPLRACTPTCTLGQVSMLPNDHFVAVSDRNGPSIQTNDFTDQAKWTPAKDPTPGEQASTIYEMKDHETTFLALDAQGKAIAYHVGKGGELPKLIGPVNLIPAQPIREWTALGMKSSDVMLAAADGHVLELTRDGDNWREQRRWRTWGEDAASSFGAKIFLFADGDHLWVSDTMRHRVLCFALSSGKLLGTFGALDQGGDDLDHLQGPEVIVGRDLRCVFFDRGNQRLVKLTLRE